MELCLNHGHHNMERKEKQREMKTGKNDWPIEEYTETEELGEAACRQAEGGVVDDAEIESLEELRRQGVSGANDDDNPYFALPPERTLLKNWMEWRQQVNDKLSNVISRTDGSGGRTNIALTAHKDKKAPAFLQGVLAPEGLRLKDEFAMKVEDTESSTPHTEGAIINENFLMFGIPRIRSSSISIHPVESPSTSSYTGNRRTSTGNARTSSPYLLSTSPTSNVSSRRSSNKSIGKLETHDGNRVNNSQGLGDASPRSSFESYVEKVMQEDIDINGDEKIAGSSAIPEITISKSFDCYANVNRGMAQHTYTYKRGVNLAQRRMSLGLEPPFSISRSTSSSSEIPNTLRDKPVKKQRSIFKKKSWYSRNMMELASTEPRVRERPNTFHVLRTDTEGERRVDNTSNQSNTATRNWDNKPSIGKSQTLGRSYLPNGQNGAIDCGTFSKLTVDADFCMF